MYEIKDFSTPKLGVEVEYFGVEFFLRLNFFRIEMS